MDLRCDSAYGTPFLLIHFGPVRLKSAAGTVREDNLCGVTRPNLFVPVKKTRLTILYRFPEHLNVLRDVRIETKRSPRRYRELQIGLDAIATDKDQTRRRTNPPTSLPRRAWRAQEYPPSHIAEKLRGPLSYYQASSINSPKSHVFQHTLRGFVQALQPRSPHDRGCPLLTT